MKLLGISGTITGSKTLKVVQRVLQTVQQNHPDVQVECLDLKSYDMQFCDGRASSQYNDDTRKVIDLVASADAYLVGTPIFQASMTGALKNLFDLVPVAAFRHKVMGFVATGGTYQHFLVVENQLKPIAGYFRCYVAPSHVYVHNDHFNLENKISDHSILHRLDSLADELIYMHKALRV
jgi:FAD reductase [NAD(P)H]